MSSQHRYFWLALILLLIGTPTLIAQTLSQTLPAGYDDVDGNSSTSLPQNSSAPQIWQWHYDSSEFVTTGPVEILEIWVRASSGTVPVNAFSFPDVEITLIEASTDYQVGNHDPDFADNIRRAEVVKEGTWSSHARAPSNGLVADWIPLHLDHSFTYNPSPGHDFIIQMRRCTTTTTWGTTMDMAVGPAGTLGGNRYGHTTSCTATTQNFNNNEGVPIVRIDYRPVSTQTLPNGFTFSDGNTGAGLPIGNVNDQIWQWHYDSSEFNASGPIAITEVFVRANSPGVTVPAFEFPGWEVTLIEASTDYKIGNHDPTFANNISRQRVVRSGTWKGGPAAPTGSLAAWVPFQLEKSFIYDPATGSDFIVQVRKCGDIANWFVSMDAHFDQPGMLGGNSYGHLTSCTAAAHDILFNELVPVVRINYVPAVVATAPYMETFDTFGAEYLSDAEPANWDQTPGPAFQDWVFGDRPTSSAGTGPAADHTTGVVGQGFYAYLEDSGFDETAVNLETPFFDTSGMSNPAVGFWVHSLDASGMNENLLFIDAEVLGVGFVTGVIPPVGDLGVDAWQYRVAPLGSLGSPVRIRFFGTTNNGAFTHDIAIDDIKLFDMVTPIGQAPQALASMDVNGATNANGYPVESQENGPYFAQAEIGKTMDLTVSGEADQPIVLFAGPLNPGLIILPGLGQFDIGTGTMGNVPTGIIIVADGATPMTFFDLFFRTSFLGSANLTFATPILAPGTMFTLQAAVFNSTASVVSLTNAVEVEIVP